MTFYLAWLIVGVIVGWGFKTFVPGARSSLTTAIVLGVIGAVVGGLLTNAYGKAAVLGPSVMGAALGAVVFSALLTFYQSRQRRA